MTPRLRPPLISSTPVSRTSPDPDGRPRFLSAADCHDIAQRLARVVQGGGETIVTILSSWHANVRWARNQISTAGEDRNDRVLVKRVVPYGNPNVLVELNETTDAALTTAVRQAERLAQSGHATPDMEALTHTVPEAAAAPSLFSEATYQLDTAARTAVAQAVAQSAATAGLLSAGYIEVSAQSMAQLTSWGVIRYFPYTWAQCSMTVRDPQGAGSGWAGVDWPDWSKIDAPNLSAIALEKCLTSRHQVMVEPGRYTTILEPQAVCDFVGQLVYGHWDPWPEFQALDRVYNERESRFPLNQRPEEAGGLSLLGERVVDERITLRTNPLDPALGFPPFKPVSGSIQQGATNQYVYQPATWIDHGVLANLAYNRGYADRYLGRDTGLPLEGAFRLSVEGPTTSVEEMIATTSRGLLVTRFDLITPVDLKSLSLRGYTRDGLWLIEQGKIAKPVKNMRFTESILFVLNNVEQLGVPQRAFHPPAAFDWRNLPQPVVVPPLKIRDFNFTAVSEAI